MPKVFVTRAIPSVGVDRLRTHFDVDIWEHPLPPSREQLQQRAQGCDGLLTLLSDTIDATLMDSVGKQLRGIANFAVGYNNIDVSAATERQILVGNTPDVLTDATADIALGLMLSAARHFQASIDQVRKLEWKTWEPLGLLGQDLRGKTLGIVGMGRIGHAVAKRCHGGWGMSVLYTARSDKESIDKELGARRVDLDTLLAESDFISVHTDLNPSTKHLFNAPRFQQMKPSAVFVNTSRGGVVDQDALFNALQTKTIFSAGLDVTDPEPLPDNNRLRELDNCVILPHIGSATFQARNAMSEMAADNLIAALKGKPMPYGVNAISH